MHGAPLPVQQPDLPAPPSVGRCDDVRRGAFRHSGTAAVARVHVPVRFPCHPMGRHLPRSQAGAGRHRPVCARREAVRGEACGCAPPASSTDPVHGRWCRAKQFGRSSVRAVSRSTSHTRRPRPLLICTQSHARGRCARLPLQHRPVQLLAGSAGGERSPPGGDELSSPVDPPPSCPSPPFLAAAPAARPLAALVPLATHPVRFFVTLPKRRNRRTRRAQRPVDMAEGRSQTRVRGSNCSATRASGSPSAPRELRGRRRRPLRRTIATRPPPCTADRTMVASRSDVARCARC